MKACICEKKIYIYGCIYINNFQLNVIFILSMYFQCLTCLVRVVMNLFTLDDIYSIYFIVHNPPVQDLKARGRRYTLLDSLSASPQASQFEF